MQITRTMQMVSTAKIRKALERAEQASPYKDAITSMLAAVANAGASDEPLLAEHEETKRVLFIAVASDRGLAGGFNVNLQRAVEKEMKKLQAEGIQTEIITCGKKPTEYFRYRKIEPVLHFAGVSAEPTMDEADRIAAYAMDSYVDGSVDRVMLYYMHAKSRMDEEMVIEQLLPIGQEGFTLPTDPRSKDAMQEVKHVDTMFKFDPSAEKVLGYLMPAYVRTVIYHALLDSAAAEHGARRRAMQSATDNAQEVITTLSRTYNRVRQGSITTELNEIIGGAAALEDK